jgi:hypothetical protein
VTATDLDRVLGALEEGQPIPPVRSAAALVEPSPTPAFDFECTDAYVICRGEGAVLPRWSGPELSGGTFDSASLAGRPAVIWFTSFACVGPCADYAAGEIREFGALAELYTGRATLLVIADGEQHPGDTAALLDIAGANFPVVFDWDGAIGQSLDLVTRGVVVLDADGRVAGQMPGALDVVTTEAIRGTLDRLLATPSSSSQPDALR